MPSLVSLQDVLDEQRLNRPAEEQENVFKPPPRRETFEEQPPEPPLITTQEPDEHGRFVKFIADDDVLGEEEEEEDEDEEGDEKKVAGAGGGGAGENDNDESVYELDPKIFNNSQQLFAVKMSHVRGRPMTTYAGFKIICPYPNMPEYLKDINENYPVNEETKTITETIVPIQTGTLQAIRQNFTDQLVPTRRVEVAKIIVGNHLKKYEEDNADFKETVEKQQPGKLGQSTYVQQKKERRKMKKKEATVQEFYAKNVHSKASVTTGDPWPEKSPYANAGYTHAVICVICDNRQGQTTREPVIGIIQAFKTEKKAQAHLVKPAVMRQFKQFPLFVVQIGKDVKNFLFPENTNFETIEDLRPQNNKMKNDIMQGAADSKRDLDLFLAFTKQRMQKVKVSDITAPANATAEAAAKAKAEAEEEEEEAKLESRLFNAMRNNNAGEGGGSAPDNGDSLLTIEEQIVMGSVHRGSGGGEGVGLGGKGGVKKEG